MPLKYCPGEEEDRGHADVVPRELHQTDAGGGGAVPRRHHEEHVRGSHHRAEDQHVRGFNMQHGACLHTNAVFLITKNIS